MKKALAKLGAWPFLSYMKKLLFKHWGPRIAAIAEAVSFSFGLVWPRLALPAWIYWAIAIVGLIWGAYAEHKETSARIPASPVERGPELALGLTEGNEYSYCRGVVDFSRSPDLEGARRQGNRGGGLAVPLSTIQLHVRLVNSGTIVLDILSLEVYYDFEDRERPWTFMETQEVLASGGQRVCFPFRMEPHDIAHLTASNLIAAAGNYSNVQFAARLANFQKRAYTSANVTVEVEAVSPSGMVRTFKLTDHVSTGALRDLYIGHWQEQDQHELLRLAHLGEESGVPLSANPPAAPDAPERATSEGDEAPSEDVG